MRGTELLSMFSNMTTTSPGMKPLSQPRRPPTGDGESKKPSASNQERNDELRLRANTQQHMVPIAGTMQNV